MEQPHMHRCVPVNIVSSGALFFFSFFGKEKQPCILRMKAGLADTSS